MWLCGTTVFEAVAKEHYFFSAVKLTYAVVSFTVEPTVSAFSIGPGIVESNRFHPFRRLARNVLYTGDRPRCRRSAHHDSKGAMMRMILLWLLGVPFSLLILLKLFGVI